MPNTADGVFAECAFAFKSSSSLTAGIIAEFTNLVIEHGGQVLEPRRDGSLQVDRVTHIISNTINFEQYSEAQAFMIPVVTIHWVKQSLYKGRLSSVRPYSPDPRMIFAQVVVTCADLPETDKESILGACMALGGQEGKDASKLTTHICALSMEHPKIQIALEKGWKGKIVLPHWFDDCFKLGKRIDEGPYTLPDPEILKKSPDDDMDIPLNENLVGATSTTPDNIELPPMEKSVRPPVSIFQDKMVMFGVDLNATGRLLKAVKAIIEHGGGRVVDRVEDCDYFICNYRDSADYVLAAQSCKYVGNLSWLYYLIIHDEWSCPRARLLHYPIPRNGIPGFKGLKVTGSNYGGGSRIYLENLIKACGAEFTKTMKADNTHLITARDSSDKCKAAPEWGIAVVNHFWIEESYAKCSLMPTAVKKYTHFPPRTNLGEVIGQVFLDESVLRDMFYPGGEETMSPGAKRKRKILEAAEENVYHSGPAEGLMKGGDSMQDTKTKSVTNRKSSDVATPVRSRRVASGKENKTPAPSTGGRSAKAKARDMLQNIAPDIALYEKEKKRLSKGSSTPFGGKRAADLTEKERSAKKRTSKSAEEEDENENGDTEEAKRHAKKSRPSLPNVEMRIVLTGWKRWVNDKHKEDLERKKLRDHGILIVSEGQPCDYLAAPQIVRTVKFLLALARGPTIISTSFIDKILDNPKAAIPSPKDYLLKDTAFEKEYQMSLTKSVAHARSNRGKLLDQIPIYCTERIKNGASSYQAIAEANGAIFKIYRARSGSSIKATTAEEDGYRDPDPVYLLSGSTGEEKAMWPRFKEMAEKGHMEPRVVAPDWLLDVTMAQEVRFDKEFLVENFY